MDTLNLSFGILAAVILFLYGLQGFAREVQAHGQATLQAWFGRVTRHRVPGFLLGAIATAVVQSSSAVSSIAVALVGSGVISFRQSLAVLFGANVGTTATAWLVAFKLTGLGPFFLVIGGLLSLLPGRMPVLGKSLFYFGFIFFSLGLISQSLAPLQASPAFSAWLQVVESPWAAILAGMVITLAVQSSSVTTGLIIVLVQQGLMSAEVAVAVVIGANLGSTGTALLASLPLAREAHRAALANVLFNVGGLLLWAPFIPRLAQWISVAVETPAMAVALAHVLFNLSTALLFLALLKPFAAGIDRLMPPRPATAPA
jgi:Na/Pi-cotransporter